MNQVNNNATVEETVTDDPSITSPLTDNKGVSNVEENEEKSIPHLAEDEDTNTEDDEEFERPDWFPQNFWDKDGPDLEKFAESYNHQRKLISQGKHKAPEDGEYETIILEEKGVDLEEPIAQTFLSWAKDHQISQGAFDDLASKVMDITQANVENQDELVADMKADLGPDADNIIRSNIQWADGLVRKGILTESEREELDVMGGTPEAQRILVKLRTMQGDMAPIPTVSSPEGAESEIEFKEKMSKAMSDPRYGVDANYTRGVEQEYVKRYNKS